MDHQSVPQDLSVAKVDDWPDEVSHPWLVDLSVMDYQGISHRYIAD